ncbi:MAG TPA: hypothetical protein ENN43_04575 [bacterium]|nr:hypothetical protein [bacterium]
MKKSTLVFQIILILIIAAGVPAGLFYYYDTQRVVQLNTMQSKVMWADNQKEIAVVKDQLNKKIDDIEAVIEPYTESGVNRRVSAVTGNRIIKNNSYSNSEQVAAIRREFVKAAAGAQQDMALLFRNGNILASNRQGLEALNLRSNNRFLSAVASQKMNYDINFSAGIAEFFLPVMDARNRLVSVLYMRENITGETKKIRESVLKKHGYNFIADTSGRVLLNSDVSKENSENVLMNPDIKPLLAEDAEDAGIKEAVYNNLRGLLAHKKIRQLDFVVFVFTPYADYGFMQKTGKTFESSFFDTQFMAPVYMILGGIFIFCLLLVSAACAAPFKPLLRMTKALSHIDEDGFTEMLPKVKKGPYRKIMDSLIILKGRITAAEEKAVKLSQMSKELEEELAKEATRADAEISELRDAVKIAENNKSSFEERLIKAQNEGDAEKREQQKKFEAEKAAVMVKITALETEAARLKEEAKKASAVSIPPEKENMRTDSVLMMNTELKGVLSVIKTYISSVLGGEGKITDAQQQFLGVVINKSARLERLINDLTELARLEKGDIKLARVPVDLNNIVQDIIFSIQPQADVKKVELKINFDPSLPAGTGDAPRLSNVVTQLLNQAIKVSPRGGQVVIETKSGDKDVKIRISDFGMSMPQSKSGALFVNFHGPESGAGPEFNNTGLRFPIIKAVLGNMGGDIKVESDIGKGKTFIISLPKNSGSAAKAPGAFNNEPGFAKSDIKPQDLGIGVSLSAPPPPPPAPPAAEIKDNESLPDISAPLGQKPPVQGSFKIQRNIDFAAHEPKPKEEEVPTVSDLLSTKPEIPAERKDIPGKNTQVPDELFGKDIGGGPALPDELPPLPELEDDKGSDIIK